MNRKFLKIVICSLILLVGIGAASAADCIQGDDAQALEDDGIEIVQGDDADLADEGEVLAGENDGIASDEPEIIADGDASEALDASDDVEVISGDDNCVLGVEEAGSVISASSVKDLSTTEPLDKYVGYGSKYKIITTKASYHWITKKSGKFKVKTKIWDMTAGFRAPYKYIDTTLYKNGKQVRNTKYKVKYKVNGRWTGWKKYGTTSTAHHRYMVYDSANVQKIKVKVKRNVNSFI